MNVAAVAQMVLTLILAGIISYGFFCRSPFGPVITGMGIFFIQRIVIIPVLSNLNFVFWITLIGIYSEEVQIQLDQLNKHAT